MSKQERILFGTDGIRGKAGRYPLTAATVLKLGQAAADVLLVNRFGLSTINSQLSTNWPMVVIGKDTRQSGDMLEAAIAAGLNSRGVDVRLAGVIPTPAVALLTRELQANFGIVISASHNPFEDNGIKFFGPDGYKFSDQVELAIESALLSSESPQESKNIGRTAPLADALDRYVHFVTHGNESGLFSGLTFALDAANGAAFQSSPAILRALGARVLTFHDRPSGLNINQECGCTHPATIEQMVKETGAQAGVSHDGDADRVLLADETGSILDGDEIMAIAAISMLSEGTLSKNTLVTTIMSNAGLDKAVREAGGEVIRTQVGDRYVVEAMKEGGYNLGGEQSGHFIFRDQNTTGDGIVAAVQLLSIMRQSGKPLSELRKMMKRFPQVQRNVRVSQKPDLTSITSIHRLVIATEETLGGGGRVLMRYSGTEPLLRILVEGQDLHYINGQIEKITAAAQEAIGVPSK